jgi:uncharacterized protein (TIGR00255 family)
MAENGWRSMTGFASVELLHGKRRFRLQLKSVNHRFFEMRVRAPRDWQPLEVELRAMLKDKLLRGSLDLWVEELAQGDGGDARVRVFWGRLKAALKASHAEFPSPFFPEPVRALVLSRFPDLWLNEAAAEEAPLALGVVEQGLQGLCEDMDKMRLAEGRRTAEAVRTEAARIRSAWTLLRERLPTLRDEWHRGLKERLAKLSEELARAPLPDDSRLNQELLLLAEKRDVAEEVQRIDSHLTALDDLLGTSGANVGKRLDFLGQELNREWTTLNNKVLNAELSREIGEAKLSVEALREQSLNLL